MERYTIYCTLEQIRKASLYGAPIQIYETPFLDKPVTAEQMIGWLDECGKQTIEICRPSQSNTSWGIFINNIQVVGEYYDTREAATLRAIDIALQYLEQDTI